MKENQLIKYDNRQIEKVTDLIAITDKLLMESKNLQQEPVETDKRILAGLAIKKQVMRLRAEKQQSLINIQSSSNESQLSSEEKFEKQLDYINNLPPKQQDEFRRRLAMVARQIKEKLKKEK